MTATHSGDETERQQRIAQAVVRFDCSSMNIELRHWDEAKILFVASLALTAFYLIGMWNATSYDAQRIKLFLFSIAATLSFISLTRMIRSFATIFTNIAELVVLIVAGLWASINFAVVVYFLLQRIL